MTALAAWLGMPQASAFDLSVYADNSVLSTGRWVKVGVPESGLYRLTPAMLRQWGFTDMSKVRVYGYGGRRIGDVLSRSSYTDDLPVVATHRSSEGIVFYGVGPEQWEPSVSGRYIRTSNIYTTKGYYFVTEADSVAEPEIQTIGTPGANEPAETFFDRLHHEQELVSPGEAGYLLVGEDFRFTPRRTFNFSLPGREPGGRVWMECSFVGKVHSAGSQITFSVNGVDLPVRTSDRLPATTASSYNHGQEVAMRRDLEPEGESLALGVAFASNDVVYGAWLNYLTINYSRKLELPKDGYLPFWSNQLRLRLGAAPEGTVVWDVSNPAHIAAIDTEQASQAATWTSSYSGMRSYVAWSPSAKIPAPDYEGVVENQNLHAVSDVDMVIFTHPAWRSQAERLAGLHATEEDTLRTVVVDVEKVYNEFASGSGDVSALRRFLKMLWDRGNKGGRRLQYALLMGRSTYDNRHLSTAVRSMGIQTIPCWLGGTVRQSLSDNDGYGTDDFIAMLGDNSGSDKGLDDLEIAVGRIPVHSLAGARNIVDKITEYVISSRRDGWKNRIMLLADDEDSGVHMDDTESMYKELMATPGMQHTIRKVYIDAYEKTGGNYPEARAAMFRNLDEGVVWWNYLGHANNHSWTHEGQLTYTDINNMYLRRVPFVYAATCDFLRWDSNTESGGEIMFNERNGGAIGMISATRPVYISDNGKFSRALARALLQRDENGRLLRVGEVYRRAKNNILNNRGEHLSNYNRLRYVFMGDPAMRLATPSNCVVLESVDGVEVNEDNQVTLAALQNATLRGSVTSPTGDRLGDFNGTVTLEIFDAEYSVTSNGNGAGKPVTFENMGDKLYAGSAPVSGGEFEIKVAMPSEIANNFRPATVNMYATASAGGGEAVGVNRNLFVYGYDDSAEPDTISPLIESMVINHANFTAGETVNTSPMVIASVSDNVGINLSTAGIGHQMNVTIDGTRTYNDVAMYYIPNADGSAGGVINYPVEDLTEGHHTLRLRVWDTSGNSATQTVEFFAKNGLAPQIFDVYCDANPARTETKFYVTHSQPDIMATVQITVYDLLGRPVWTGSSTGRSDMSLSTPVRWDLTDGADRRVKRGIYLYRATISTDSDTYETASRKIAVTAP